MGGRAYSHFAERSRNRAETERTLLAAGHPPDVARAIAEARPETLRQLERAGLTPEQIQGVARHAPLALQVDADTATRFASAMTRAGFDGGLRELGFRSHVYEPERVRPALDYIRGLPIRP